MGDIMHVTRLSCSAPTAQGSIVMPGLEATPMPDRGSSASSQSEGIIAAMCVLVVLMALLSIVTCVSFIRRRVTESEPNPNRDTSTGSKE